MNLSKIRNVNQSKQAQVTQDLFLKFDQPQKLLTSLLRSSQRAGSLSSLILPEQSPSSSLVSTIKSPQMRRQYKLSEVNHNLGDSWRTLVHLGDKSLRETNTQRSSMKCFAWRLSGSLKRVAQFKRECSKVYASWTKWPNGLERCGGYFIAPQGNLPVEGVRDPDMSGLGGRHVWQHSLEPGRDTGHVRCLA
jgi:hypothetical protein